MGGNIWKSSLRYNKNQYNTLVQELLSFAKDNNIKMQNIPHYTAKETFGDVDIIIVDNDYNKEKISSYFIDYPSKTNNKIKSILYNNFQIDFIFTNEDEFKSSIDYYSYNDLGNLIGRISKKLGIKYGHKGLSLIVRDDTHIISEILFEKKNAKEVLYKMIGIEKYIDYVPNTMEDIFNIVISSKFFDKEIYSLENRNNVARVRDKKRITYHNFLNYIKNINSNFSFENKDDRGGYNICEPFFTNIICKEYPHLKSLVENDIKQYNEKYANKIEVRNYIKINYNLIKEVYKEKNDREYGRILKELNNLLMKKKCDGINIIDIDVYDLIKKL